MIKNEPKHRHNSAPRGTKEHNGSPLHKAQQKGAEKVERNGSNRGALIDAHGGKAVILGGEIGRHQTHDGRPQKGVSKAVDAPNHRHSRNGRCEKDAYVTQDRKRNSRRDDVIGFKAVSKKTADNFTCSVSDGKTRDDDG